MKIAVRDGETGNTLGAIQVTIKDGGGSLDRIAVRVFGGLTRQSPAAEQPNTGEADRRQFQRSLFARMLASAPGLTWTVQQPSLAGPHGHVSGTKTIEIRIALPDWHKVAASLRQAWRWYLGLARPYQAASVIVLLMIVFGLHHLTAAKLGPPPQAPTAVSEKPTTLTRGTPKFATILPAGKTITSLGGWVRISPPDRNPVYAFIDHFGGIQLSVSEQPLPQKFRSDPAGQVAQLAQGFNATQKVTDADGTIVYIGTAGNGAQSVILSKHQLLVLIKSVSTLTPSQWTAYTSSLK